MISAKAATLDNRMVILVFMRTHINQGPTLIKFLR